MFVRVDFSNETLSDVFGGGFFNPWRTDEHDVEVRLDVADGAHVFPEVGATARGEDSVGGPLVEGIRGFVTGGEDVIGLEEVHLV